MRAPVRIIALSCLVATLIAACDDPLPEISAELPTVVLALASYCQPCDGTCPEGDLCVDAGHGMRCAPPCNPGVDVCPAGLDCLAPGGGPLVCLRPDGTCRRPCVAGWDDCNGDPSDGCETPLGTETDCTSCGNACTEAFDHATGACVQGTCVRVSCDEGFDDCDGVASNGCETSLESDSSCGACGTDCDAAFPNRHAACVAGTCMPGDCVAGWKDCDGEPETGCETRIGTAASCSDCDDDCATRGTGNWVCGWGSCVLSTCPAGSAQCGGGTCDTVLGSDAHCSGCGDDCVKAFKHVAGICIDKECRFDPSKCESPFRDCDAIESNGCEVNTHTNAAHCGDCNHACAAAGATGGFCVDGLCVAPECPPGTGPCPDAPEGECVPLDTEAHCGGCQPCSSTQACVNGTCVCQEDMLPCGDNGECVPNDTLSDCGFCGNDCVKLVANATAVCKGGKCAFETCFPGFGDCDKAPSNGCETDLNSSSKNCDACFKDCSTSIAAENVLEVSCSSGVCKIGTCKPGYTLCTGPPEDVCADLQSDPKHCDECDVACDDQSDEQCISGKCQ